MTFLNNCTDFNVNHSNLTEVHGNVFLPDDLETILKVLRDESVVDAQYNSRVGPSPCHPDTRKEILRKIDEWISDPRGHPTCWLYGLAGSGKSAIAQSVSNLLADTSQNCVVSDLYPSPLGVVKSRLVASFFFNRQDKNRCNTDRFVASIAYQIAISIPTMKRSICDVVKRDQTILTANFEYQLLKLLIEPLQSLPEIGSSLILVIDALDECENVQDVALLVNPQSNHGLPFRFFVTSRRETHILGIFRDPQTTLSYNLQDFAPRADIELFLKRELGHIRQERSQVMYELPESWPSSNNLATLVERSSGLFIYASTAVKFIRDRNASPHKQLEIILNVDNSPGWGHSDLNRLYTQVLSAFPDIELLRVVIGAIILLRVPLSPRALAYFLGIKIENLLLVLEKFHSILSIPENIDVDPVTTFHISLRDFLTSHDRAGIYYIDPSEKDNELARCCLNRIATLPKFTFSTLRDPMCCMKLVQAHLRAGDRMEMDATRYGCLFWSSHLSAVSLRCTETKRGLEEFGRYYVIPWRMFLETNPQEQLDEGQLDTAWYSLALLNRRRVVRSVWLPVPIMLFGKLAHWVIHLWNQPKWVEPVEMVPAILLLGLTLTRTLIIYEARLSMRLRLALRKAQVKQYEVERCVLRATPCIHRLPLTWRIMFSQALITTQKWLDRQNREPTHHELDPQKVPAESGRELHQVTITIATTQLR